ncbi:MAG: bifunctional DNA primase/polymerase [Alphaproteobacteria bacterium]|nr:bifunctional DNA primase/polymerase [Alphaproteobacteria bacterium]
MSDFKNRKSMLDIALQISTELGLSVFPCREKAKGNKKAKSPYTNRGYKDASRDEKQIWSWWNSFPNAMVGVPTGRENGIFVVDIDVGQDKDGEASFNEFELEDPHTCQTITMSGGRHLIFAYPAEHELKNTAGALGKDIDTRGDGGYVIWAGSTSTEGAYSYREGFGPEVGFNELPPALLERLTANGGGSASLPFTGAIPNGQRNSTLFKEAVSLASKKVAPEVIAQHVISRLQDCEGNFPVAEAEQVLQSALNRAASNTPPFTDLGNAERFSTDHADVVLYCKDQRIWYCWDSIKWTPDYNKVQQLAKQTTRNMLVESSYSDEHRSKLKKWQHTSESSSRQKAMIELAASDERLVKQSTDLDQHLHLFNAADGTIDLRSGEVKKPDRTDLITCAANASITSSASCNRWTQFINEIMCGDQRLIAYLQRLCGYMMFGDRGEQIIVYLQGDGANGKSVFIDVLSHVFGDYAATISARALIDRASGAIPSDIASIAGKRLVTMSEFPERVHINTTTVKSVTGGDRVTARHLYKDWFEFRPQFQLLCAMNELPKVAETDEAYLRRVRIIPFLRVFSPAEMDRNLQDKLKAEADGILQWCIEGARLYQQQGLRPTARMVEELERYRRRSDPVAQFVRECVTTDGKYFHTIADLIRLAREYMVREEMTIPDEAAIKKSLIRMLGETKQHRTEHGRVRGYFGLKVCMPMDDDLPF